MSFVLCSIIAFCLLSQTIVVNGQDLVTTQSVTGGGSAFVFRGSSKAPQAKYAGGYAFLGESRGGGGSTAKKNNTRIASAAAKRRANAIAARKKAIASANKKVALSNSLTAKAEAAMDADQIDPAITSFRGAIAQNPKNSRAINGLSDALTKKGIDVAGDNNDLSSVKFLEEAVKLDKTNDVAFAKLGAVYDANGQSDKAIENYEKAIAFADNKDLAELHTTLGMTYLNAGEIAKADASLKKAEAAGSDTADTRMLRGLISLKQNDNQAALAAFEKTLEIDGRNAEANYHRAQALGRLDHRDQSIAAYEKTLEIDPMYAPASFDLGVAYYNNGDYPAAVNAYQKSINSDPKNGQAHANLASTYRQLEQYPQANAEYKVAAESIKTADLYSEWGYCLGKVNEWDKSVDRLHTAEEISPTAIDNSNVGWAYYNSGAEKAHANNEAGAKEDYEKGKVSLQAAVEKDPNLDAAYLNLGSTHNGLGEFQDAVNVLNVVVGRRKGWTIAMNQLGLGYRGMGDLANAVSLFKQVVNLDSKFTFGLFNLGEAYNASGNKKEAKKINDQLRKIDPSMASALENIFSGKAIVNDAKQKVKNKIPKTPKLPF